MIPGGYGDPEQIAVMLRADATIDLGTDVDSRIDALNVAISLTIDEQTGRTFGDAGTATSELVWIGPYDTSVLNRPATAITSITYGGTVAGSSMTGGTTVLAADLIDVIRDVKGRIYAIRAANGFSYWWWYDSPSLYQTYTRTPVLVTATYDDTADDPDALDGVPEDIRYIVNYMVCERLKVEKAGPGGLIGPTGDIVPVRDVFNDPLVKRVLDKYTYRAVVV